jgi:hypothetical protein
MVCGVFNKIRDRREDNASYHLADLLKMGFAMFSLKSPSLLNFVGRTQAEDSNLGSIYKIGAFASENGLRKGLDGVSPAGLRTGFQQLWKRIRKLGILDKYRYWGRHLTVSVDGAAAAQWNTSVRVISTARTAWSVSIRMERSAIIMLCSARGAPRSAGSSSGKGSLCDGQRAYHSSGRNQQE